MDSHSVDLIAQQFQHLGQMRLSEKPEKLYREPRTIPYGYHQADSQQQAPANQPRRLSSKQHRPEVEPVRHELVDRIQLDNLRRLIEDLQNLVDNRDTADLVFIVGHTETPVYAHRCILNVRWVIYCVRPFKAINLAHTSLSKQNKRHWRRVKEESNGVNWNWFLTKAKLTVLYGMVVVVVCSNSIWWEGMNWGVLGISRWDGEFSVRLVKLTERERERERNAHKVREKKIEAHTQNGREIEEDWETQSGSEREEDKETQSERKKQREREREREREWERERNSQIVST